MMHVNLLPASAVCRMTLRRLAWRWSLAAAFIFSAAGAILGVQYAAVVQARQAQAVTAFKSQSLHAIETQIERLTKETKSIEETVAAWKGARPEDRTLALLGIAATSSKQLNGKLHLKQLMTQITASSIPGSAPLPPAAGSASQAAPAPAPGQSANDFVLEGIADDSAVIADFVAALKETGVFSRVDLTASTEAATATQTTRQFRLDCKF